MKEEVFQSCLEHTCGERQYSCAVCEFDLLPLSNMEHMIFGDQEQKQKGEVDGSLLKVKSGDLISCNGIQLRANCIKACIMTYSILVAHYRDSPERKALIQRAKINLSRERRCWSVAPLCKSLKLISDQSLDSDIMVRLPKMFATLLVPAVDVKSSVAIAYRCIEMDPNGNEPLTSMEVRYFVSLALQQPSVDGKAATSSCSPKELTRHFVHQLVQCLEKSDEPLSQLLRRRCPKLTAACCSLSGPLPRLVWSSVKSLTSKAPPASQQPDLAFRAFWLAWLGPAPRFCAPTPPCFLVPHLVDGQMADHAGMKPGSVVSEGLGSFLTPNTMLIPQFLSIPKLHDGISRIFSLLTQHDTEDKYQKCAQKEFDLGLASLLKRAGGGGAKLVADWQEAIRSMFTREGLTVTPGSELAKNVHAFLAVGLEKNLQALKTHGAMLFRCRFMEQDCPLTERATRALCQWVLARVSICRGMWFQNPATDLKMVGHAIKMVEQNCSIRPDMYQSCLSLPSSLPNREVMFFKPPEEQKQAIRIPDLIASVQAFQAGWSVNLPLWLAVDAIMTSTRFFTLRRHAWNVTVMPRIITLSGESDVVKFI